MGKKDEKFTASIDSNYNASEGAGNNEVVFKENRVFEAVINRVQYRWEPHGSVMLSDSDINSDDFKAIDKYFHVVRR